MGKHQCTACKRTFRTAQGLGLHFNHARKNPKVCDGQPRPDPRDAALAACTEMRAALERHVCQHVECSPIETHAGCHARHTLSRPDLGAGWASPEVVAQMVGALQMVEGDGEFDSLHEVTRKFVVDVLALLDGGKGRG